MAAPAYGTAGTGALTASSGVACTPGIPGSTAAGDLLIAHVFYGAATTTPDTPADWTLVDGPRSLDTAATNGRTWVYAKKAVGSDAAPAFGTQAVTTPRRARVYRFTGVPGTVADCLGGWAFAGPASAAAIADVGVTTPRENCLAVNLVAVADDNAVDSFTGMTGGTWAEAVAQFTGTTGTPDTCLQLQTATMAAAGTVDGGSYTMGAADPWGVTGFYIKGENQRTLTTSAETDAGQAITFTHIHYRTAATAAETGAAQVLPHYKPKTLVSATGN